MVKRKILVVDDQQDAREHLYKAIMHSEKHTPEISLFDKMKAKLSNLCTSGSEAYSPEKEVIYDVQSASGGEQAFNMVADALNSGDPFHLIFLDIRMPEWDGLKTLEEIFRIDKKIQAVLCADSEDDSWKDISSKIERRDNLLILKKPFDAIEVAQLAHALTEKYFAEEHLRHSQKMEIIGELSAGLAHDFNNIISSLQATLSSMEFSISMDKSDSKLKKELRTDLDTLKDAVQHGADMVMVLMSLSKRQELPLSPVNLNELMERVIKICSRTLDKSVEVKFIPSENDASALVYPVQIEEVLLNICINASHAMTIMREEGEKQGGTLTIRITDEDIKSTRLGNITDVTPGKYRHISLEDTGVGIKPATMSRIFDPFFTTKGKGKGTGLGLSMAFNIIRKHKGFLDVNSVPDQGTVFSIYLPAVENN